MSAVTASAALIGNWMEAVLIKGNEGVTAIRTRADPSALRELVTVPVPPVTTRLDCSPGAWRKPVPMFEASTSRVKFDDTAKMTLQENSVGVEPLQSVAVKTPGPRRLKVNPVAGFTHATLPGICFASGTRPT